MQYLDVNDYFKKGGVDAMKEKLIAAGIVILYFVIGILAVVNCIHVEQLSTEEVSYVLRSESMFGAILWWMLPILILAMNSAAKNSEESKESTGDHKQTEENVTL